MSLSPSSLLILLLSITAVSYLIGLAIDLLELSSTRTELPPEVTAFYDPEKYAQSVRYHREHGRFSLWTGALGFVASFLMLLTGGFGWLDHQLRYWVTGDLPLALAFFGVLALASDLLGTPFQWYSTFVIEARYGFNKTTARTFWLDKFKGYALGALIGGAMMAAMWWLIAWAGDQFWIWFGLVAAGVMLVLQLVYTSWLLPLFNKLTPLADGPLKTAIEAFATRAQFPVQHILVLDGSRRSSKANAFFSGFGRSKKIVLYDTLIEKHTTDELVAILAHEVGHYKKRHIVSGYILSVVQVFFMLFILAQMLHSETLSLALGAGEVAMHVNLIAFAILISPLSGVLGIWMNALSRRHEFEADAWARHHFSGAALASALKRLSVESLSELYPHPAYVWLHYSHPPLLARLQALEEG